MSSQHLLKVSLIGNPNSGKSTLFNALTGLNQKTGNYSGVTVDKLEGQFLISNARGNWQVKLTDLPGTYNLFAKSIDEKVAVKSLFEENTKPDVIIMVVDSTNLKRHLQLASQVLELGIPTIIALNMIDEANEEGIQIDTDKLKELLDSSVYPVDSRGKEGIEALKEGLLNAKVSQTKLTHQSPKFYEAIHGQFEEKNAVDLRSVEEKDQKERSQSVNYIYSACVTSPSVLKQRGFSKRMDSWLTHPFFGYVIFLLALLFIFQFIFFIAEYPMEWIENGFVSLSSYISDTMSEGVLRDLLTEGILSGIGGVVMFIPQIALLFMFIVLLEDSGYMARASFIMDKLLRPFGLNGRSVIPIISASACAVPSIMSTRSISMWKERFITIFVIPLVSCSARLPVYTLLIGLMVPNQMLGGFINLRGLVLLALYLLGFLLTLITAFMLKSVLKTKEQSFFIMELPVYRVPLIRNVVLTVWSKIKVFIVDAGKIIFSISILLWFLSSYGPGKSIDEITIQKQVLSERGLLSEELNYNLDKQKLESSFIGKLGKGFEPVIKPLGYDWKIGIALITSFAAREVFVGTMSTIYGVSDQEELGIREKLQKETKGDGSPRYTIAVCLSLCVFYVIAMQCMSTLAIVKRETKSWKWPILQFSYLSILAYISAWITFILFS